jgi:malate synthase
LPLEWVIERTEKKTCNTALVPKEDAMNSAIEIVERESSFAGPGDEILTPEALTFIELLALHFEARRLDLLKARTFRQVQFDSRQLPEFLEETRHIREAKWTVAPIPGDLLDRRVEITGPPERKMVINAFNSGANVFMADFEDSNAPTWNNCVEGQLNLRDANQRAISYRSQEGKLYELSTSPAVLFVRPRG